MLPLCCDLKSEENKYFLSLLEGSAFISCGRGCRDAARSKIKITPTLLRRLLVNDEDAPSWSVS